MEGSIEDRINRLKRVNKRMRVYTAIMSLSSLVGLAGGGYTVAGAGGVLIGAGAWALACATQWAQRDDKLETILGQLVAHTKVMEAVKEKFPHVDADAFMERLRRRVDTGEGT